MSPQCRSPSQEATRPPSEHVPPSPLRRAPPEERCPLPPVLPKPRNKGAQPILKAATEKPARAGPRSATALPHPGLRGLRVHFLTATPFPPRFSKRSGGWRRPSKARKSRFPCPHPPAHCRSTGPIVEELHPNRVGAPGVGAPQFSAAQTRGRQPAPPSQYLKRALRLRPPRPGPSSRGGAPGPPLPPPLRGRWT